MNSQQVEIFVKASKCRSFSEAASRLYISPAAICRNIAKMEEELGFPLFLRDNHKITLTEAGTIYLSGISQILDVYREVVKEAVNVSREASGELVICVLDGQMLDPLTQKSIVQFEKEHPKVNLELARCSYGELSDYLDTGRADVALTMLPSICDQVNIVIYTICQLETRLVLPQTHRLSRRRGLSIGDFRDDVFLTCADANGGAYLNKCCSAANFVPKILAAPNIQTQMLWLETGRGISIANPNHMMCNSPTLTEVELTDIEPEEFIAAWHQMNRNPMVKEYINTLRAIQKQGEF